MKLYINSFLNSFYKCDKCNQAFKKTFKKKSEFKIQLKEHTYDSSDTIGTSEEKDLMDGKYSNDVSLDKCSQKDDNKFTIVSGEVCFEVISY